jgi:hypothetical protein
MVISAQRLEYAEHSIFKICGVHPATENYRIFGCNDALH